MNAPHISIFFFICRHIEKASELREALNELESVKHERDRAKGQLGELKTHLEDLRSKQESTIKQRDDARTEVDSLAVQLRQIENLKGKIATLRDEMAVLTSTLNQAELDNKGLNAEIARMEGLLAVQEALKAQIQEVRETFATQTQALKNVREEKQKLHVEVEAVKGVHQETRNALATANQDLRLANQDVESAMSAEAAAKATLEDLQARFADKSQQAKEAEADCVAIKAQYSHAKAQLNGLKTQLLEVQEALAEMTANLAVAVRDKESQAERAEERLGQIEELRTQLSDKVRENTNLVSAKDKAIQEANIIRGQLVEAQANSKKQVDSLMEATAEVARVSALVAGVEGRMKELHFVVSDMDAKLKQSNHERDKAIAQEANTRGQLAVKGTQLVLKEEALDEAKAAIRHLQEELEKARGQLKMTVEQLNKEVAARKDADQEIGCLTRALAPCESTIDELKRLNSSLDEKAKDKELERREYEVKYLDIQEQHKKSAAVIQSLRSEIEEAQHVIREQDLAIREARRERDVAIQNRAACEAKLAALMKQLSDLEVSFDHLEKEHAPCAALIAELRAQILDLQNEVREH